MKGMKIFYSLVNRSQTLKISLGRIRLVLWPQRHYQSWMSLPSLCCGYSHTTHAAGPHLNPSWGTQTLFQLCQRSPGLRPCFMDGWPMLQPHVPPLTVSLSLFALKCTSWMDPELAHLLLCLWLPMDPDSSLVCSDPVRQASSSPTFTASWHSWIMFWD